MNEMVTEMVKRYMVNLMEKASTIRKKVVAEYMEKYGETSVWDEILEHIQEDAVIDRRLNKVREKVWGNLPKGRDDFDVLKVLGTVPGGKETNAMDYNALKHDAKFKDKLKDLNIDEEQLANLQRVLSVSSSFCLNLLGVCNKASVDGTNVHSHGQI